MSVINKNLKMSGRELLGRDEITEEMIAAGKAAYWGHFIDDSRVRIEKDKAFTEQIKAIYTAMKEAE